MLLFLSWKLFCGSSETHLQWSQDLHIVTSPVMGDTFSSLFFRATFSFSSSVLEVELTQSFSAGLPSLTRQLSQGRIWLTSVTFVWSTKAGLCIWVLPNSGNTSWSFLLPHPLLSTYLAAKGHYARYHCHIAPGVHLIPRLSASELQGFTRFSQGLFCFTLVLYQDELRHLSTQKEAYNGRMRCLFTFPYEYATSKECSNYHTIALISHASKVMLKILQASFYSM